MKKAIHPKFYDKAKVTCTCGHTFTTGSVMPEIRVEICADCHPYYTGEMRYIDTLGRVDRFKKKQADAVGQSYLKKKQRKILKKELAAKKALKTPKTLKDMLKSGQSSAK